MTTMNATSTKPLTAGELSTEWQYRYEERLGNLAGANPPTADQRELAAREANQAVRELQPHITPSLPL